MGDKIKIPAVDWNSINGITIDEVYKLLGGADISDDDFIRKFKERELKPDFEKALGFFSSSLKSRMFEGSDEVIVILQDLSDKLENKNQKNIVDNFLRALRNLFEKIDVLLNKKEDELKARTELNVAFTNFIRSRRAFLENSEIEN